MVSRKNISQFYCQKPCLYKKPQILSTTVAAQQLPEDKRIKSSPHIVVNKFYFQRNFRTDKKVNILKRILKHLYSQYIYKRLILIQHIFGKLLIIAQNHTAQTPVVHFAYCSVYL